VRSAQRHERNGNSEEFTDAARPMQDAEKVSEAWQVEAQAALERADRLTELLAEGLHWLASATPRAAAVGGARAASTGASNSCVDKADASAASAQDAELQQHQGATAQLGSGSDQPVLETVSCPECGKKDAEVTAQLARVAELDIQVRSLKMETLRATQLSAQVGRVVLPALYSIESRLVEEAR
jgi:hypothetical protein